MKSLREIDKITALCNNLNARILIVYAADHTTIENIILVSQFDASTSRSTQSIDYSDVTGWDITEKVMSSQLSVHSLKSELERVLANNETVIVKVRIKLSTNTRWSLYGNA